MRSRRSVAMDNAEEFAYLSEDESFAYLDEQDVSRDVDALLEPDDIEHPRQKKVKHLLDSYLEQKQLRGEVDYLYDLDVDEDYDYDDES